MKMNRLILAALLCGAVGPAAAEAQQRVEVIAQGGRGMLGIMTEAVPGNAQASRQRVIRDVVAGSPAEQAGLVVGDTILRINGLAATDQVMGSPFEPGDTVVLRVRRGSSERDVTVVATPRTNSVFQYWSPSHALPDSVMRQMTTILRAVQADVDTLALRGITIERLAGDSNVVMRFGNDSVRVFHYRGAPRGMMLDSVLSRFRSEGFTPHTFGDSVLRQFFRSEGTPGAHGAPVFTARPFDVAASSFATGMRSVAGAELSELNPGLAEYFGVLDGVLVLDARDGTPAARAGIRAGDVIVRINGEGVTSVADVRRTMAAAPATAPVPIRVLRRGQHIDLTLPR